MRVYMCKKSIFYYFHTLYKDFELHGYSNLFLPIYRSAVTAPCNSKEEYGYSYKVNLRFRMVGYKAVTAEQWKINSPFLEDYSLFWGGQLSSSGGPNFPLLGGQLSSSGGLNFPLLDA